MAIERSPGQIETLDRVALRSIQRLTNHLRSPQETVLRAHQVDVFDSYVRFLEDGNRAGYLSLPTGYGKTVVAAELIHILGLKTVILSPKQEILRQTRERINEHYPDITVSNYYADEKDLSGRVINTTYQSFPVLLENGKLKAEDIELLICDESHRALGEARHRVFRQIPNALMIGMTATPYFKPLEGFQQRKIVDVSEDWVDMFTKKIHEMGLEEAMARGILSHLDIHLFRSRVKMGNLTLPGNADYRPDELERYLNISYRNSLTVAMLAGVESIPAGVIVSENELEEIDSVHRKIAGRPTAYFGVSIDNAERVAALANTAGVATVAVHSSLSHDERRSRLIAYETGDAQTITSVGLLEEGWDSPKTEVGIFARPTRSGIIVVQQLGRILRPGKDRAIAIQLVDQVKNPRQAPIVIPNIFDPEFVLRGTQIGEEHAPTERSIPVVKPITVSGIEAESILEESKSNQLIKDSFRNASIPEISGAIDHLVATISDENPSISAYDMYTQLTSLLPVRVPSEVQELAIRTMAKIDSNEAALGQKVLFFLNLKSALTAIEPFVESMDTDKDDLVQATIGYLYGRLTDFRNIDSLISGIHSAAKYGIAQYIAGVRGCTITEVLESTEVPSREQPLEGLSYTVSEDQIIEHAEALRIRFAIEKALNSMKSPTAKTVVGLRRLYENNERPTLDEVGEVIGVTPERVRQIEEKAERSLRGERGRRLFNLDRVVDRAVFPEQREQARRRYQEWLKERDSFRPTEFYYGGEKVVRKKVLQSTEPLEVTIYLPGAPSEIIVLPQAQAVEENVTEQPTSHEENIIEEVQAINKITILVADKSTEDEEVAQVPETIKLTARIMKALRNLLQKLRIRF